MASPIRWFREHSQFFIVVFGVLLMAIFGLGTIVSQLDPNTMRNRTRSRHSDVVVNWDGGQLSRADLFDQRQRHFAVINLMQNIYRMAVEKNGGQTFQPVVDQITPIALPGDNVGSSELDERIMNRYLFAKRAEQEGFIVDETMVLEYFTQFAGDMALNKNLLLEINRQVNPNVPLPMIIRQMQIELLWQQMEFMTRGGSPFDPTTRLSANAISPTEAMELYIRSNRNISCQVLPLPVDDFVSKVTDQPSDTDLRELFESGRYDYPAADFSQPGFKQRRKVLVQYFKADLETFMQNEMAKLTDEEVQKEYERLVEAKDNLVMELVPPEKPETPANSAQGEDGKSTDKPAAEDSPPVAPTNENSTSQDGDAPTAPPADPGTPTDESPGDSVDEFGSGENESDSGSEESNNSISGDGSYTSLTTQDEDDPLPPDAKPESQSESGVVKPAIESSANTAQDEQPESSPDAPPSGIAAEQNPTDLNQQKSSESDESNASNDQESDPVIDEQTEPERRPRELKDVAESIRRRMKGQDARAARDKAISTAEKQLRGYNMDFSQWEMDVERGIQADKPAAPDFKAIADELRLQFVETALVDALAIKEDPIGKADHWEISTSGPMQINTGDLIFAQFEETSLFQPGIVDEFISGSKYIYWLKEKVDQKVLEFEEAREDVVKYWKRQRAIELAQQEAARIADDVNASGKRLSDVYGEKAKATGVFSWFATVGRLTYGTPDGVVEPGEEFMRTAFGLENGKSGAALNDSRDTVYVVQVVEPYDNSAAELGREYLEKNFFKTQQIPREIMAAKDLYQRRMNFDWIEEFRKSMKIQLKGL